MKPRARRSPGPYGIEPRRRKRQAGRSRRPARQKPARRFDVYHALSVVMGAFCGLALYSLVVPGHLPDEAPPKVVGSRLNDLALMKVDGRHGQDGMYHVHGQLFNKVEQTCRYASVSIRFFDRAGALVTKRTATAEQIAGGQLKPFTTEAYVPNAVHFEVSVDLAHF